MKYFGLQKKRSLFILIVIYILVQLATNGDNRPVSIFL